MKLYGSLFSPYVRHCRVALAETGLAYEFIESDVIESAQQSPTARVPYLADGSLRLHDSASILRHIRTRAGQAFLPDLLDYELFLLANTGMDTTVNLFLLERDGLSPEQVPYLARQASRVDSVVEALESHCAQRQSDLHHPFTDGLIRVGCYLNWATFRDHLSFRGHVHLEQLMIALEAWAPFARFDPRRMA